MPQKEAAATLIMPERMPKVNVMPVTAKMTTRIIRCIQ